MKKLFLILLLLPFGDAFAQAAYPMICKGPFASMQQGTWIQLKIGRGTGPAGPRGENLKSGQCAFLDRGIQANEPDIMQFYRNTDTGPSNDADVQYRNILYSIEQAAGFSSLLLAIRSPNEYFKVMVRNINVPATPYKATYNYFGGSLALAEFWQF
jgi:hypothetical protein